MRTPSEEFNLPVIGTIYCQLVGELDGVPFSSDIDEYEVIKIIPLGESQAYVCNVWHKPGVPQMVPKRCVIRFEERF
jgi:hypothetical protein